MLLPARLPTLAHSSLPSQLLYAGTRALVLCMFSLLTTLLMPLPLTVELALLCFSFYVSASTALPLQRQLRSSA